MTRYDRLLALEFPETVQHLTRRDTILYALGVGAGSDDLPLVIEDRLSALASMAVTLAYPGFWYRNLPTGLDHARVLHASERFVLHRPLPVEGTLRARPRISGIYDKGEGRGALIESTRHIVDDTGAPVADVIQTAFALGDGGLGGPQAPAPRAATIPDRAPDQQIDIPTDPRAALIYRLSGDDNPLHADPAAAALAGFDRPVLHGLSSMGHVCRQLWHDGHRDIRQMQCRFTGVVFPGDTLRLHLWQDGPALAFRAYVGERRVLDAGQAQIA